MGDGLWIVDGPDIRFFGIPFSTRMTVVKLASGGLWLHSPIRWSEASARAVTAEGAVTHLIAPNWIHYAYVHEWNDKFPDAEVWAAPGVQKRAKKRGVPFPAARDLGGDNPWAGEIETLYVAGSAVHDECVFFHHASRTLILTDLIENFEPDRLPRWMGWLVRAGGIAHPDGRMAPDMAFTFRKGQDELRAAIRTMLDWQPEKIVLAHGRCIETDATERLRNGLGRALKEPI